MSILLTDPGIEKTLKSKDLTKRDIAKLIKYCKQLLESRKAAKWKICQIAERVCDPPTGRGGHTSPKHSYTYFQFARDIGIVEKTLWRWRKEYLVLYSKVDESELKDLKRKQIEEIISKVNKDTSKADTLKMVREYQKKGPEDGTLLDYLYRFKGLRFFIKHSVELKKLDQDNLKELHGVLKDTVNYLDDYFKKGEKLQKTTKKKAAMKAMKEA